MSQTSFIYPIDKMTDKLSSSADGRVIVTRRKCFGKDAKGKPIYGPNETYIYHRHKGKWSKAATQNRTLFQQVQVLVKEELNNPERLAYWQQLFEQQFLHPKQGKKHYTTLRGFIIAHIHQQLKSSEQKSES